MARFVAFLRGMNLGRRRIKNDELCSVFEDMGFRDVAAFLASGNVVFETRKRAAGLPAAIARGLQTALDYDVPTFIRSGEQVCHIAGTSAFSAKELAASAGKTQVAMLAKPPTAATRKAVSALATRDDRLAVHGRELYWLPVGNLSDSALDMKAIERTVGPMTVRTKRTIDRLVAKYFPEVR
jgi:uncharacterized protein (DUF1697 family)